MPELPILNGHKYAPASASHDRLTDTVVPWIVDTLRTTAMGERITWEAALQLANGPQGPTPVLAIYLQTQSPVLGQACVRLLLIEAPMAGEANVRQNVTTAVAQLFADRAQAASIN